MSNRPNSLAAAAVRPFTVYWLQLNPFFYGIKVSSTAAPQSQPAFNLIECAGGTLSPISGRLSTITRVVKPLKRSSGSRWNTIHPGRFGSGGRIATFSDFSSVSCPSLFVLLLLLLISKPTERWTRKNNSNPGQQTWIDTHATTDSHSFGAHKCVPPAQLIKSASKVKHGGGGAQKNLISVFHFATLRPPTRSNTRARTRPGTYLI